MKDYDIDLLDNVRSMLVRFNKTRVARDTSISPTVIFKICNNPDYRPSMSIVKLLAFYMGIEG